MNARSSRRLTATLTTLATSLTALTACDQDTDRPTPPSGGTRLVVEDVIDGDTLHVTTPTTGQRDRLRVVGIDTPETYPQAECGGTNATAAAKRLIAPGTTVTARRDPTQGRRDSYGRLLAFIELPDGRDFGQVMLRTGHARSTTWAHQPRHDQYARAQNAAQKTTAGLWACTPTREENP